MQSKRCRACSLFLLAWACSGSAQPLVQEAVIPLPNVNGRIDHFAIDVPHKRLFVAALGNNTVAVIDLEAKRVVRSISGLKEPQGLFYWPEKDELYVANGRTGAVNIYGGPDLTLVKALDFNSDADNIRFDPGAAVVYVGYGDGALGIVRGEARLDQTMLDRHPESFQLERNGSRIFVNVPRAQEVEVVDRRTRTVIAKWPVSASQNFPMALDEAGRRLFVGCRRPAAVLVLDTSSGKQMASIPIVGDSDDLFYDPDAKRIYASGGAGAVTVIEQKDADHYATLATIPTAPGARTSYFSAALKRFYVAVPHRGKQPAEVRVFSVSR